MLEIDIPGYDKLKLEHLVMDYNGTLACDGILEQGVMECLQHVNEKLKLHIITADTFGKVQSYFSATEYTVQILPKEDQVQNKQKYIERLNPDTCVCIGNGRNDSLMLKKAALGIAVMLEEGVSKDTILAADIFVAGIIPALQLLVHPLRLIATLRT